MKATILAILVIAACDQPSESKVTTKPSALSNDHRSALLVMLHAYQQTPAQLEAKLNANGIKIAQTIYPAGTIDTHGKPSYNAGRSCCDETLSNDDEAAIVAETQARVAVGDINPERVYVIGTSNGGFMAVLLACDHGDLFSGIVDVSGAGLAPGDAPCTPTITVPMLHLHGTVDASVGYSTPSQLLAMPELTVTAPATLAQSMTANGCGSTWTEALSARDIDQFRAGFETDVLAAEGCPTGGGVELWRVNGAPHTIDLRGDASFMTVALRWLDEHNRVRPWALDVQHTSDAVNPPVLFGDGS